MRRIFLLAIMAIGIAGFLAVTATPSLAVHAASGQLTCGNCHTMHSSQGNSQGATMGTNTGVLKLLRSTSECSADLCLMCHAENGASAATQFNSGTWQTTPPKVYLTTTSWVQGSPFTTIGAGGDFKGVGSYLSTGFTAFTQDTTAGSGPSVGYGHSLCEQDMYPPGGNGGGTEATDSIVGYFTCANCHDPHGTEATQAGINLYRNLLGVITTQGDGYTWATDIGASYVGGIDGSASDGTATTLAGNIWPISQTGVGYNTYKEDASNVGQMSRFCAQCHGKWHEALTAANKATSDWRRHPVDNALVDNSPTSGSDITIVDWGHYDKVDSYADMSDDRKMPVIDVGGSGYFYADDPTDKVFCLSCHFPHASQYYDGLRWDYQQSVDVGTQVGKGLDSKTGCQQCHNRGGSYGN